MTNEGYAEFVPGRIIFPVSPHREVGEEETGEQA
jgi:hypothetical protein